MYVVSGDVMYVNDKLIMSNKQLVDGESGTGEFIYYCCTYTHIDRWHTNRIFVAMHL